MSFLTQTMKPRPSLTSENSICHQYLYQITRFGVCVWLSIKFKKGDYNYDFKMLQFLGAAASQKEEKAAAWPGPTRNIPIVHKGQMPSQLAYAWSKQYVGWPA